MRSATCRAQASSSTLGSPNPALYVRIRPARGTFVIKAQIRLLSTPPDRYAPTGTSATIASLTEAVSASETIVTAAAGLPLMADPLFGIDQYGVIFNAASTPISR